MGITLVAFGLYGTLLDVDSLQDTVRQYTPMAEQLVEGWRSRRLQLANLATTTGRYVDFDSAPQDSKRLLDAWTDPNRSRWSRVTTGTSAAHAKPASTRSGCSAAAPATADPNKP